MVAQKRQNEALELRAAGYTYDRIAEQLGFYDKAHAYRAVAEALKRAQPVEAAEELRSLTTHRYDRLLTAYWPRAIRGDEKAFDRVIVVEDRRAKLLGLNAPTQITTPEGQPIEVSQTVTVNLDGLSPGDLRVLRRVLYGVADDEPADEPADSGSADPTDD
jgi:hypothetical protein